ncbi:MAG TPA: hypothetical protein VFX02_02395 [Gammaproteobacteria bacterium]|nr:hypothetical protein [Gammaproteobacteria bacterium]
MGRLIFRLVVLLITVVAASCIPPQVATNSLVIKKLDSVPARVFILSFENYRLPDSFQKGYVNTIASEFNALGSTTDIACINGLELDRNAHVRKVDDFHPDAVMILRFQLNQVTGDIHNGTVGLSLGAYPDKAELWKSSQNFQFQHFMNADTLKTGAKLAGDAFRRLLGDNVFSAGTAKPAADKQY